MYEVKVVKQLLLKHAVKRQFVSKVITNLKFISV